MAVQEGAEENSKRRNVSSCPLKKFNRHLGGCGSPFLSFSVANLAQAQAPSFLNGAFRHRNIPGAFRRHRGHRCCDRDRCCDRPWLSSLLLYRCLCQLEASTDSTDSTEASSTDANTEADSQVDARNDANTEAESQLDASIDGSTDVST